MDMVSVFLAKTLQRQWVENLAMEIGEKGPLFFAEGRF